MRSEAQEPADVCMCNKAAVSLNWKSFLKLDDNKKKSFHRLTASVQSLGISDVQVISTADVDVLSSSTIDKAGLAPCNHEEADTRIFVHARYDKQYEEDPYTNC